MTKDVEEIDLTPSWRETAQIIAVALENGTEEGKELARRELYRMASTLDKLIENEESGI